MPADPPTTDRLPMESVGTYELISKIADGGMGSVYKGRSKLNGELVAIKIVPPHMASNQVLIRRFQQEFNAASRVNHPNLVRALDCGYEGNTPFLVMEYVDGETLGQRLDRQGKLSEKEAIKIIAQIAQGLNHAHNEGIVHRDVKPDNILITPGGVAKLADMGLVKEIETELNLTRTGRGLGTPQFMAPEQFRNAKNADARCDIYSLAATLYMAITGELPFKSCSPLDAWMKKVNNDFPAPKDLSKAVTERVDWAIRRAMSADPTQRPATCREFVEDLMGRSTRRSDMPAINGVQDVWFMAYQDEFGTTHTVKGTLNAIRRCLKEGRLGDAGNVRVSRSQAGPFQDLRTQPEFRDLVIAPAALPGPGSSGTNLAGAAAKSGTKLGAQGPRSHPTTPVKVVVDSSGRPQPGFKNSALDLAAGQGVRDDGGENVWRTVFLILMILLLGFAVGIVMIYVSAKFWN
jgi:serine/threonine protein kinase